MWVAIFLGFGADPCCWLSEEKKTEKDLSLFLKLFRSQDPKALFSLLNSNARFARKLLNILELKILDAGSGVISFSVWTEDLGVITGGGFYIFFVRSNYRGASLGP